MRWRSQRDVIRDVLLAGNETDSWLTLEELGKVTGYREASISAQIRHLKKPKFGAYRVRKRVRERQGGRMVWEYTILRRPEMREEVASD